MQIIVSKNYMQIIFMYMNKANTVIKSVQGNTI